MRMARAAVFAVFMLNGLVLGSWASRVPALAKQIHASPGSLGLGLLGTSVGLLVAAPFAGRLCVTFGARLVVLAGALATCLFVPLLGTVSSVPMLGVALALLGASSGLLDVSMNIAAVAVARWLDRPLMPLFHAAFSFGGLFGSLVAGQAAALGWSPLRHFTVVALLGVMLVAVFGSSLPGARPEPAERERRAASRTRLIRRPVLWLLAAVVLGSAVAEGATSDWSALFLVRQRDLPQSAAAAGYAAFSIAMAVTRALGEHAERRWGPYRLLAGGATVAAIGLFGTVLVPADTAAYVGFALVGAGLAYCFPLTLALAGAAGRRADGSGGEREIGFVTTIAYVGFMAGPPLIGAIAQLRGLSVALGTVGVVVALIVPAVLAVRLARQREEVRAAAPIR